MEKAIAVIEGLYSTLEYLYEKALQTEDEMRVAYLAGELSGVSKAIEALEKII